MSQKIKSDVFLKIISHWPSIAPCLHIFSCVLPCQPPWRPPFQLQKQQPQPQPATPQRRGFARWRGTINFQLPGWKARRIGWRWTSGGGWNVKPGWRNTFPSDKKHISNEGWSSAMMELNGMLLLIIFRCAKKSGSSYLKLWGWRLLVLGAKVKYLMNFGPWSFPSDLPGLIFCMLEVWTLLRHIGLVARIWNQHVTWHTYYQLWSHISQTYTKIFLHRSLFIKTLPNFASQDVFFGRVIYRDRGNQPTNPPKKNNRGRYRITGHRTGSREWFGFLSSGCRVLAWLRYRGPPLLLGVFWVAGPVHKTSFLLKGRLRPVGTVSQICLHVWKTRFSYIIYHKN